MKILKVINNNVISAIDENQKEIVIMGKGIGFQKKANQEIEKEKIEKIFYLSSDHTRQFEELVANMPYEHMQVAEEIIQYAKDTLGTHLNRNIYITLTDHLNFAIEREKQGIAFENALLWEIKKFYRREFQIGQKALEMVEAKTGVQLDEAEAGFIALHIANAESDGDIKQSITISGMIKDMLNIVCYTFGITIDDSSLSYERFVTHLKFFIQRAVQGELYDTEDLEFNKNVEIKYAQEYQCALRIKEYMNSKVDYPITDEEIMYLTTHISRVVRSSKDNKKTN